MRRTVPKQTPANENDPGIRVIPPLVFLAALAAGFVADWLWPVALLPGDVQYWVGGAVMAAAILVMPATFRAFRRAGTPFDVRKPAEALVTEGPYRHSRNPGYVALIVFCFGIAILADNVWVLAALVPATALLDSHVIRREERHLEATFGEAYRDYRRRVRRWL